MAETTQTPPLPNELPVVPLRGAVVLPLTVAPLGVSRPLSLEAVNRALAGDRMVLLLLQKSDNDEPGLDDLNRTGTVAIIRQMAKGPGGMRVLVEGVARARAEFLQNEKGHLTALIKPLPEPSERSLEIDAHVRRLQELVDKALSLATGLSPDIRTLVTSLDDPLRIAYLLASLLDIKPEDKQRLLEENSIAVKLDAVSTALAREIDVLELKGQIESRAEKEMTDAQRQYLLRQQLKAIQSELGEGENGEAAELRKRVQDANLPEAVAAVALKEVDRLERMTPAAPEYQMIRTYLDWLLDVPWAKRTDDRLDPIEARKVLDEDHYDLDKVKERIVEYLAVRKLKGDMKGPILCFVGPPGVGKTSLGRSIARALDRKFVRISLGGVRDEAEIRGHRRTYVGALPGRFIQSMKKAGMKNPVMMLDEIDKLGADFRGDPSAALLEVLDPEQNNTFSDHYLDVAFDLSKVMFIATANQLDPIPGPLRDRMEIIELTGYTFEEKQSIARIHLVPKQLKEHGLTPDHITISDEALLVLTTAYTREAGVRNLERRIADICRAVAVEVAGGKLEKQDVDGNRVKEILGPEMFYSEVAERTEVPGVSTGLAWTAAGGDLLFIEATKMAGKGGMTLTGQLGDVMKESATAALSYLRSKAEALGINPNFLEKTDLHLHFPAGSIPKDGPSAGVTILTALTSLLTGIRVRSDTAMTGEATLRGLVLPVGGIKEKVLAAHRAGIKRVILPERCRKDLIDVPDQAKKELEFIFVTKMDEVLMAALETPPFKSPAGSPAGGEQPQTPLAGTTPEGTPEIRAKA
jgi:ATP-dependent Lon protease